MRKDEFSPMTLQFYTSCAAMLVQFPLFVYWGVNPVDFR